jgi:hypothetical protein
MTPHKSGTMTISHSSTAQTLAVRRLLSTSPAEADVALRSGDFSSTVAAMIATQKNVVVAARTRAPYPLDRILAVEPDMDR